VNHGVSIDGVLGGVRRQRWNHDGLLKRFMRTTTSDQIAGRETSDGKEVAIDKDSDKSKLFRRKKGKKGLWRKSDGIDFVPALYGTLGLYLNF
jgi:HSP20 family protein